MRARSLLTLLPLLALACAAGEASSSGNPSVSITNITNVTLDDDTTGDLEGTAAPTSATTDAPTTTGTTADPVDPPSTSSTTGSDTTGTITTTATTATSTTTGEPCDCDAPPDACHTAPGECIAGECVYPSAPANTPCDDADPCTDDDRCDDAGTCNGTAIVCTAPPHATGGACEDGICQGFKCTAPYLDCDGLLDNGCEVPVGVANQCDANGLTASGGCWTAYCGASDAPTATNFGTYYCSDCATCNTPGAGQWQWCNHKTGTWFDPAVGNCGANEDLVCAP